MKYEYMTMQSYRVLVDFAVEEDPPKKYDKHILNQIIEILKLRLRWWS
jgi:hypothetical protein